MSDLTHLEVMLEFAALDGYQRYQDELVRIADRRRALGLERDSLASLQAWLASRTPEQRRELSREQWERRKADPVRYEAHRIRNREHMRAKYLSLSPEDRAARNARYYLAIKSDPEKLANRKAKAAAAARRRRAAKRAQR